MFDNIPANTITNVKSFLGAFKTSNLKEVPINPLCSATAIPKSETSTVPSGAKEVKLVIRFKLFDEVLQLKED